MKKVYAPGCALMIYKPELAEKVLKFLNEGFNDISEHQICCRHEPQFESDTLVINTCTRCDKRYREISKGISTVSLWEMLAESETFPFPDYNGMEMAIHDACPARTEERIHSAIRKILEKMNIKITEPKNTRSKSVCCGDCFYDVLPLEQVKKQMNKRSNEMPCDNVVVYCVYKAVIISRRWTIEFIFKSSIRKFRKP